VRNLDLIWRILTLRSLISRRLAEFSPEVQRVLRIDVSVMLLFTVFNGFTTPFNGLILRRDLGASPLQLSLLGSANAACLLGSLILTRLIDSRRPLAWVVWPNLIARGLFLLVPLIASPWPFIAVLVAGNLLGALASPAQAAVVQQVYPRAERSRALSAVRVAGAAVAIALAVVSGRLMGWLTYRWVFFGAGLVGMAASLRQRRVPVPDVPADTPPSRPGLSDAWRAMRRDRGYREVLLGAFVFGSGVWLLMPATPLLLVDVLHVTTTQVGLLTAVAAAAALVGNVVWGRLADRRSSLAALRGVYLVGMLTPLIYYFAHRPAVLIAASITESLMATGLDLVWMLVVIDYAGPRRTAQYAAIAATLAGVRGVIGPLVGAALIHALGLQAVYLASALLMAAGAWLVNRQVTSEKSFAVPNRPIVRAKPALERG
jgi:MFS transporter, DHA1 family, multidrug resistance protein